MGTDVLPRDIGQKCLIAKGITIEDQAGLLLLNPLAVALRAEEKSRISVKILSMRTWLPSSISRAQRGRHPQWKTAKTIASNSG